MNQNIDTLCLGRNKIVELKNLGYNYCNEVNKNVSNLENILIDCEWSSLIKAPITKTAFQLCEEELLNGCILSYNEDLDVILRDLIVPESITELTGHSGSGKTQMCFQLCITVQLPKWCGGFGGEAVYISTNRNFAPNRIREMAKNFVKQYYSFKTKIKNSETNFNEDFILKHIHQIKIDNVAELMACLIYLEMYLVGKNVRLLVLDSISYPIRRMEVKNRFSIISKILQDLRTLAAKFSFAIILTNDLTTRATEGQSYATPSFGDSFYHLVNSRVLLCKNSTSFHGKLMKSIFQDQKEVTFHL